MFAVWDDEAALDAFLALSAIGRRWSDIDEAWHVRLRLLGGHGSWRGVDPLEGLDAGTAGGPVAIVTRADVRPSAWRTFGRAGRVVDDELHRADGLIDVVGIGEAPIGRLATFSLWESLAAARRRSRTRCPITSPSSGGPAPRAGTPKSCSPASNRSDRPADGTAATRSATLTRPPLGSSPAGYSRQRNDQAAASAAGSASARRARSVRVRASDSLGERPRSGAGGGSPSRRRSPRR